MSLQNKRLLFLAAALLLCSAWAVSAGRQGALSAEEEGREPAVAAATGAAADQPLQGRALLATPAAAKPGKGWKR